MSSTAELAKKVALRNACAGTLLPPTVFALLGEHVPKVATAVIDWIKYSFGAEAPKYLPAVSIIGVSALLTGFEIAVRKYSEDALGEEGRVAAPISLFGDLTEKQALTLVTLGLAAQTLQLALAPETMVAQILTGLYARPLFSALGQIAAAKLVTAVADWGCWGVSKLCCCFGAVGIWCGDSEPEADDDMVTPRLLGDDLDAMDSECSW